jgi:hypothetical protein
MCIFFTFIDSTLLSPYCVFSRCCCPVTPSSLPYTAPSLPYTAPSLPPLNWSYSFPSLSSPLSKAFIDDLKASVEYVIANPSAPQGNAAIYGMTSSLPPGPVNDLLKIYNDVILKL